MSVVVLAALASPSYAADTPDTPADVQPQATDLPTLQVTGISAPIKLNTPGTVSVITREQIDRYLVQNIRDLVRYEPGVSVVGTAGRFGLDSFNIRGLSGNRTRIEIDGASLPASFGASVAGSSFRAGRNQIDMDNIKEAEIVRGPASALYPSDALGGMVSLKTKDPTDYLQPGKSFGGVVKESYDSSDNSRGTTATLAFGDAADSLLLQANYRQGHETDNKGTVGGSGSTRTRAEPLEYTQSGFLAKYVHNADSGRRDFVSVESARTDTDSNSLASLTTAATYYLSQDSNRRFKLNFGQSYNALDSLLADTLDWTAYWQKTSTRTNTQTETATVRRYYSSLPTQETVYGGRLVATKSLGQDSSVAQTLSYGLELSRTTPKSYVGGYGVNKTTGVTGSTSPYVPGSYPLHLFPNSDTDRIAVFAQDKIDLLDGRLTVTPGVRVDHYEYKPGSDALYYSQTGSTASSYSTTHASPKLGVQWKFNENLGAYFNYTQGFRAPLYNELDGAWAERAAAYNIAYVPNPDLKEETSKGGEIGLRGNGAAGWFNISGYYTYYDNFIWNGYQLATADIPAWVIALAPNAFVTQAFQAVNAKHAIVKGIEASGQLQLDYFNPALAGWSINASASLANGRLIEPGNTGYTPLNTVDPAKAVLGVGYSGERWGAELVGTGVRRHSQLSETTYFRPPGYGKVDLFAHYRPTDALELNVGLNNLTDRKYWDWGNLQGGRLGNLISGNGLNDAVSSSSAVDLYTMPGRSISASLRYSF
ncbi:TonB-dependent hemoglobin/transferrin/lactoferrin family receptor [Pseudoxanthomonas sp.]|uniref:TonB-dependent hemoglobin/transferrin/lactoferrin family receptor n=1 Tax=Pseudoxanthomonas sp. TaxID=1871049 RepID=UPI00261FCC28|nr:TonB-dependent hemoglobin/transferrin/lactoferrin family receptor [Pseudoxanthomonas sp.]WDS36746.1 MAG: TonB-dependent hemoglobin/transferrin/lactoferrin family receptor [Pseudoxanthomonas sp.]